MKNLVKHDTKPTIDSAEPQEGFPVRTGSFMCICYQQRFVHAHCQRGRARDDLISVAHQLGQKRIILCRDIDLETATDAVEQVVFGEPGSERQFHSKPKDFQTANVPSNRATSMVEI